MYNNPYYNFNQQSVNDRIDNQIAQLQQMKDQIKNNQPAINQTFQLAPNHQGMKFVNTIDDVVKETVYFDMPFFSKDMSVLWVKNTKGDIKTYELTEIVPKDERDLQIEYLMAQVDELKGKVEHEQFNTNVITEQNTTNTTGNDEPIREAIKSTKSSSISKVSGSKKK